MIRRRKRRAAPRDVLPSRVVADPVQPEPAPEVPEPPRRGAFRRPRVRVGAVVALAVAAGVIAWVIVGTGDSSNTTSTSAAPVPTVSASPIGPVGLSATGLATLTQTIPQPIYWAGRRAGALYELTRTSTGKVFIRYLPPNVKVGVKRSSYLIVATYPFRGALQAIKNLTNDRQVPIPGGGLAIVDPAHPTSVHLAYPGVDYQVEVYDPSPAVALRVATSGSVAPVPVHP